MVWSAVSGIVGVLVGLFLGHRLSFGRDKRREFNQATEPFRGKLRSHLKYLERRVVVNPMTAGDLDKIVETLGEGRSAAIIRLFDRYTATVNKCVSRSSPVQESLPISPACWDEIINDAKNLYDAVQPR